jgi:hypothetical protein
MNVSKELKMFNDLTALDTNLIRLLLEAEGMGEEAESLYDATFSHMLGDTFVYRVYDDILDDTVSVYVRRIGDQVTITV